MGLQGCLWGPQFPQRQLGSLGGGRKPRLDSLPAPPGPLTQAAVPCEEPPEDFALLAPVSASSAVAPGCHARASVVHVVGGDGGACRDPESRIIGPPG